MTKPNLADYALSDPADVSPKPLEPKPIYTVDELAEQARVTPKVMRLLLRKAGFPPPGKGSKEIIRFSDLRTRDPGLADSLLEVPAVRARLGLA